MVLHNRVGATGLFGAVGVFSYGGGKGDIASGANNHDPESNFDPDVARKSDLDRCATADRGNPNLFLSFIPAQASHDR